MPVTEMLALMTVMASLVYGFVTFTRTLLEHMRRTRSERMQADVYNKLLDKLGTGQELVNWANSDSARKLLHSMPVEQPAPYSRILNSVQNGLILAVLGAAVLSLQSVVSTAEGREGARIAGTLVMAIGVGMLLAGGASWALSRKFGLINGENKHEADRGQ